MRFPASLLDEIRARIRVSDIVARKVRWDRRKTQSARGDYWACCPFHDEKTPSFHADDRKGRYHCFGCGAGGDIFTFLTETEGMPFPEAVEMLANQAGLEVLKPDPRASEREEKRSSLYDVMDKAARFFEQSLHSDLGRNAANYLAGRGTSAAAIARFRVGYAPAGRYALKEHMAGEGVSCEQMIEAGLLISGDDIAVPFDRFRDRIMFPIPDSKGRMIAFGGRALASDAKAKYLNSPETALFSKRAVLYNYAGARASAYDRGEVIVAEGYMDVIALAMAGFEHAVAPLGTALTERQVELLWRLAPEPILCFDGDEAGQRAALRAVSTVLPDLKPGRSIRFAFMPEGQDPDDLLRSEGIGAVEDVINRARPLIDVLWESETRGNFDTPERRAALDARLDETLSNIRDERVRVHYRAEIKQRLSAFWRAKNRRRSETNQLFPQRGGWQDNRLDRSSVVRLHPAMPSSMLRRNALARDNGRGLMPRECVILLCVINHPRLIEDHAEELASLTFSSPQLDSLAKQIIDITASVAPSLEEGVMKDQVRLKGYASVLARMEQLVSNGGDWFAKADASVEDAKIGWLHTVARQRKYVVLARELRAAECELAQDTNEATQARVEGARSAFELFQGNEANIEGYGAKRLAGAKGQSFNEWEKNNKHRLP
jgi:DNA primase